MSKSWVLTKRMVPIVTDGLALQTPCLVSKKSFGAKFPFISILYLIDISLHVRWVNGTIL